MHFFPPPWQKSSEKASEAYLYSFDSLVPIHIPFTCSMIWVQLDYSLTKRILLNSKSGLIKNNALHFVMGQFAVSLDCNSTVTVLFHVNQLCRFIKLASDVFEKLPNYEIESRKNYRIHIFRNLLNSSDKILDFR